MNSHQLSLVYTRLTRHDTTVCNMTQMRTNSRQFFSLVPHIPCHDRMTRYWFITNSMTILQSTVNYKIFSQEDNASGDKD